MELNNIIFSFFLIFFGYFFIKYLLLILQKSKSNFLADDQFNKPQAFHEKTTYRLGGLVIFSLLVLVYLYLYFFKNILYFEYISFCTLFFLLGLIDDLKVKMAPKFRLIMMGTLLIILVIYNKTYIERSGLLFLNNLLEIDIFALFFICLCFLFIINGANLIDGFNGLLCIHTLIILVILFSINLMYESFNLAYILFYTSLLILIFLKFNFPKAQAFLGDSGAYLVGSLIAVSVIKTSILNPLVHPFFFCVLLFYLFFEVFFSFFRKIFFARQSPLLPDNKHLHMSLYKLILKKNSSKITSNYLVTSYINLIYFLLIIPAIIFMNNGLFCRYYFFSLLIVYIFFYKTLYEKLK